MRLLFCGDVMGRAGRDMITTHVPELRRRLALDAVVINGENAAGGVGITGALCKEFYGAGVDAITGGNHSWDRREVIGYIDGDPRLLRPLNYAPGTPGRGHQVIELAGGRRLLVINVMLRLFMELLDDPFRAVDAVLKEYRLAPRAGLDAILVDVHGEATSEKQAMGVYLDGRVSMVVGSHTHVPTADHRILPGGTAFQTDTGMCGAYDSVIGMRKDIAVSRFIRKLADKPSAADGPGTLCGLVVETDATTGLARRVAPVRIGGDLAETAPDWDEG